jgi:hypothetical protein
MNESGFWWRLVDEKLRVNLRDVDVRGGAIEHPGLRAVLQTNLEMSSSLTSTDSLLLHALGPKSDSEDLLRQTDFADVCMRLSVLDASRCIPAYALGAVFDEMPRRMSLRRYLQRLGLRGLRLRRLAVREKLVAVMTFWCFTIFSLRSQKVCASTRALLFRTRLRSIAERFCGGGDALDLGFDWSVLCQRRDCGKGEETSATYACDKHVRHTLASSSGNLQDGSRSSRILGFLCSYKRIRARASAFDQPTVLRDFATAVAGRANVGTVIESAMAREESSNVMPFYGEVRALETIAEVGRVSIRAFLVRSAVAGCTASMIPVWPPSYTAELLSSSLSGSTTRRSATR